METKSEKDNIPDKDNIILSLRLDNRNYSCCFMLEDFVDNDVLFPLEAMTFNQLRSLIQMVCCKYTDIKISSLQRQFNKDNKTNDVRNNQIRKKRKD